MGGGLIQLVSVGVQDIYMIGNPQITFFKTVYKRHTNFAIESMPQSIDGRTDFGQTIEITIDRKGDLIRDIICHVELPILPTGYYWTNGIGNALIRQVDLEIGGQLIDRHYSEWMDIWSQLTINESKIGAYNQMVGNYNSLSSLQNNAQSVLKLNIPFFFWFNRDWSVALPLIALQFHEVKLRIYLRDFNSCYRNDTTNTFLAASEFPIGNFQVWVDYVLLDMDERREIAQQQHEILIDQVQVAGDEFVAKSQSAVNKKLAFNHPVKELYWVHTCNDYLQQNLMTGNQCLNYSLPTSVETFSTGLIQLNGIDRFKTRSAEYFRLVQNYQYHTRYSAKNIYTYSFGLFPEKQNPSGTCNMSKITTLTLNLGYGDIDHSGNNMVLKVFGVNYNILRIMSGMAGLSWSN